jgi:hypothetical protein
MGYSSLKSSFYRPNSIQKQKQMKQLGPVSLRQALELEKQYPVSGCGFASEAMQIAGKHTLAVTSFVDADLEPQPRES